jgi:hypothetical protein
MNPIWAFFFKDKFKTPFSVYRMSLAELLILLGVLGGLSYGAYRGTLVALDYFETQEEVPEETPSKKS